MKYRVSKDARDDLDRIFVYWANRASLETAERLIDAIMDRFWLIGEHPGAGRAADEISSGVRCFPAGEYLIYYRKTTRPINVLHIVHGARDQRKAFRQKPKSRNN